MDELEMELALKDPKEVPEYEFETLLGAQLSAVRTIKKYLVEAEAPSKKRGKSSTSGSRRRTLGAINQRI